MEHVASSPRLPRPRIVVGTGTAFLILALLAFGKSLLHDFAPIDDSFLLVNNLAIRGITWENLRTVFTTYDPELYIPLTFVSYQLNYLLGGLHPFGFHLGNILLHSLNALLVTWILLLFTKRKWVSLLGGLLFLLHPLHTEAVVWIAGRKDLLSTFFVLLSLILYLKYRVGSRWAYALSLLCFLFALLSKVMSVTLPAVLLLIDILIERRTQWKPILLDKLPYLILSIVFLLVAMAGKERVLSHLTLLQIFLMSGKSTVFYLQKLVAPVHLSPFYPFHGEIRLSDPQFLLPLLFILSLLATAILTLRRTPWVAFSSLFFLITLSPTFANVHKGGAMFFAVDRYAYLPSVGMILLLIVGLGMIEDRFCAHQRSKFLAMIVAAPLLSIFTILSAFQTAIWESPERLFSHALGLYPDSVAVRTDLARLKREAGAYEEAFAILKEGLTYGDDAYLHLGAGYVYAAVGSVEEAREQFTKASLMDPKNPEPVFAIGVLEEHEGDLVPARASFERAVAMDPSYVAARVKLGLLDLKDKHPKDAEDQFREALAWNRSSFEALAALGQLLAEEGRVEESLPYLRKAAQLNPRSIPVLLALARISLVGEHREDGRRYLERILQLDQGNDEARAMLGTLQRRR